MTKSDLPSWCVNISRKRPEVALLVYTMICHGIRTGKVTAEATHHISVTNHNSRGASVKLLARCGFRKGNVITGTTKKSHGHFLHEWVLNDYSVAKGILNQMASLLTGLPENNKGQLNLL